MRKSDPTRYLYLTQRGQNWLSQFDPQDEFTAKEMLLGLTLVSHTAFLRSLESLVRSQAARISGPVALYATRELYDDTLTYFQQAADPANPSGTLDAVARGTDVGSEARIAAMIRNMVRDESGKFLNHPSIEEMRNKRCRAIFVIDDLIGSGERTREFIDAMWRDRTIRSWWSLRYLQFFAVAYTSTEPGERRVRAANCKPKVVIDRACPTFDSLPWSEDKRDAVRQLCRKYSKRTSVNLPLGYGDTNAALIFEHGSPDNVPSILWARATSKKPWRSLFPSRTVLPEEQSAFPAEIARRDSITLLVEVGQRRLARASAKGIPRPLSENVVILLAFAAKGVRRSSALSYATGLSKRDCAELAKNCMRWGLLSPTGRITTQGLLELRAVRKRRSERMIPEKGEEDYYPQSLRSRIEG